MLNARGVYLESKKRSATNNIAKRLRVDG